MRKSSGDPWFVYVLRCADGSLYTGITKDVPRRGRLGHEAVRQHLEHREALVGEPAGEFLLRVVPLVGRAHPVEVLDQAYNAHAKHD